MRNALVLLALLALLPVSALMQEKGGEDEFGPYEVVANWPQPIPGTDGWTWGSTGGVFAETPDRVWIGQRGMLPLKEGAKPGTPTVSTSNDTTQKWIHTVIVVDRDGKMVQTWPQADKIFAQKGARGPHKIKMNPYDPQKHVWIMDDNLHQIFKFTYDGKLVMTLGEALVRGEDDKHFGRPTDIDWLPDGTFFISDGYTNTRVVKFDPNGKYLTAWGTSSQGKPNPGPNEMHTVHSVAVGKDRKVYVSDRTNSRIQIFDENGKFLDMWTNIRRPYHVLMSRDQFLWVSDGETHKMLKYDLNGKFLYGWGTFGPLPGRLNGVHQFSVDQDNNLYVAEVFNARAQKFRPRKGADPAKLTGQELRHGALWTR